MTNQHQRNFYEILNASSNSTFEELKSNYKQLILQCHPDKLQQQLDENDDGKLEINDDPKNLEFVVITEAWNCLKDPIKRKQYDAELLLNKFHTHNNIYAQIQLKEMKKIPNTGEYAGYSDEAKDGEDDEEEEEEEEETKAKYLYTYDCRCGGQYIVDESAEQYCRTGNNNHDDDIQPEIKNNSKEDDNAKNNSVDDDDDDDDADTTSTQNKSHNSPNMMENENNGSGVKAVSAAAVDGSEGVGFVQDNNGGVVGGGGDDEENDEGGELIVECSECSLVIILNG